MLGTELWAQPLGPPRKALNERPLSYTMILVIGICDRVDLCIPTVDTLYLDIAIEYGRLADSVLDSVI